MNNQYNNHISNKLLDNRNHHYHPNINYNNHYNQNMHNNNNPIIVNPKIYYLSNLKLKFRDSEQQKIDITSKVKEFENFSYKINYQFSIYFNDKISANFDKIHISYNEIRQNIIHLINIIKVNSMNTLEKFKSKVLDILENKEDILNINFSNKRDALDFITKYKFQLLFFLFRFIIKIPVNLVKEICQFIENKLNLMKEDSVKNKKESSLIIDLEEKYAINKDIKAEKKECLKNESINNNNCFNTPNGEIDKNDYFLDKHINIDIINKIINIPFDYNFNQKEINDFKFLINNKSANDKIVQNFLFNTPLIVAVENYFKIFYKSNYLSVVYVFPDLYEKQEEFLFTSKSEDLIYKPKNYGYNNYRLLYKNNPLNVNLEDIKIVGALYLPQNSRIYIKFN